MAIQYGLSDKITFSHPIGLQRDFTLISEEILLKAYRDKIGTEMECDFGHEKYIISNVNSDGKYIFIECIKA